MKLYTLCNPHLFLFSLLTFTLIPFNVLVFKIVLIKTMAVHRRLRCQINLLDYIMVCCSYLHWVLYQWMRFSFGVIIWHKTRKTWCQNKCYSYRVSEQFLLMLLFFFLFSICLLLFWFCSFSGGFSIAFFAENKTNIQNYLLKTSVHGRCLKNQPEFTVTSKKYCLWPQHRPRNMLRRHYVANVWQFDRRSECRALLIPKGFLIS